MNSRILILLMTLFLLSCAKKPTNKEYVTLTIPEELEKYPAVVEELNHDVEQINEFINSLDKLIQDFLDIQEDIEKYDTSKSTAMLKTRLSLRALKIQSSYASLALKGAWWIGRKVMISDSSLISPLSENEVEIYRNCLNNIELQEDLINNRLKEIEMSMHRFDSIWNAKFPDSEDFSMDIEINATSMDSSAIMMN